MQPNVKLSKKEELISKMICMDLSVMEKERYLKMLSRYPDLFITSYEEIRGFKGEDLRIQLKEGARLVKQRIRTMG